MNKITTRVHIRWMVRKDTQEVLAIEDSLTESRLISLLRTRNNIGMVATIGGQIVGLMIYALHKEKIKLFYKDADGKVFSIPESLFFSKDVN